MMRYSANPVSEHDRRVALRVATGLTGQATTGCRAPHQATAHAREPPSTQVHFASHSPQRSIRRDNHLLRH